MRVGVERGIVAIVAAQVLEDVGEMVSMSWAAVPNDRDRREATTIRRMQAFPLQPLTGEHFVERRRSWSEVPSGLVGCDVHKEIYPVPFRMRSPLAQRNGASVGMLALVVASLASLRPCLFGARDGSASREAAVLAL